VQSSKETLPRGERQGIDKGEKEEEEGKTDEVVLVPSPDICTFSENSSPVNVNVNSCT